MAEYYFIITCIPNDMADYLLDYNLYPIMIWQSITLLLLVSQRYGGSIMLHYNLYP